MSDVPAQIYAKSAGRGQRVTLAEHTAAVLEAVEHLFGEASGPTRLAERWLKFFRLTPEAFEVFWLNLWLAAAWHDIGKANDGFQHMVTGQPGDQVLRHEHLSGLLVASEAAQRWFSQLTSRGVDPEIVFAAVVSHHLKISDKTFAKVQTVASKPGVSVYATAADVREIMARVSRRLGIEPPDLQSLTGRWDVTPRISVERDRIERRMYRFGKALHQDPRRRGLLLAIKAALVVADAAGSGIPRAGRPVAAWLDEVFGQAPLTAEDVRRFVIEPRVAELTAAGRWRGFQAFQTAAAELGPRGLLLAGCGAGKTLAAWLWITRQVETRGATRAIFLYPTRATATEGFRDYGAWAGPEQGALIHGTARFDLVGMFQNADDERRDADYTVPAQLFALGFWPKRVIVATVDSFLAFVNHRYAALCLLPLLVDSVVVVDEVHSFDRLMFRSLERCLKAFDCPLLAMTASLPTDRLRALRDGCGLRVFPEDPAQFAELAARSGAPRYHIQRVTAEAALEQAVLALRGGRRVMWVANTVDRCQQNAVALRDALRLAQITAPVLCYHSRFRLVDRRDRHEAAVRGFQQATGAIALVTTQVCEMSLDLDADVLISEIAPVTAVIQRLGRCARSQTRPAGDYGEVYLYSPEHVSPYTQAELQAGEAFTDRFAAGSAASQDDLAQYLAGLCTPDPYLEGGFTGFLDSGWYAMARDDSFRDDTDDYTREGVLDTDIDAYRRAARAHDETAVRYLLPVPRQLATRDDTLGPYLVVAPASHYTTDLGLAKEATS